VSAASIGASGGGAGFVGEKTYNTIARQPYHGASDGDRDPPLEFKRRRLQTQYKPVRAKPSAVRRFTEPKPLVEVSGEIIKETRTVSCYVRLEERACRD
jgi:hypothetical protein